MKNTINDIITKAIEQSQTTEITLSLTNLEVVDVSTIDDVAHHKRRYIVHAAITSIYDKEFKNKELSES